MNERVPLSFLIAQNKDEQPPVEPVVPFAAMFGDDVKIVTAVLDRTAVLSEPSDRYERKSVRHDQVLVDPAVVSWRTVTSSYEGHRLLNAGTIKPGSAAARSTIHILRQPQKTGAHWRRSMPSPINPGNVPGAEARQASDERALKNQAEVAATKTRELAAHRQRQPKRIEEEAMSTVITDIRTADTTSTAPLGVKPEKTKRCVICGNDKPASAFPVGPRGPQRCLDCRANNISRLTLPPAATPAPSGPTNGGPGVIEEKARKPRLKKGRATHLKRRGKKIKLGETVTLSDPGPHAKVLKLLEKRDALRAQLVSVQAELAEAVAG